jgi:hypothetical protein
MKVILSDEPSRSGPLLDPLFRECSTKSAAKVCHLGDNATSMPAAVAAEEIHAAPPLIRGPYQ